MQSFFGKDPEKRRVLVSAPVDLREMLPEVHPLDVGNYTGSLIFQVFREKPVEAQVHGSFQWIRRGVPHGVVRLLSLGVRDECKVEERFERQAALPIPKRAPFENYTFAFSSIGRVRMPALERMIDEFRLLTFTQTILVVLATGSFNRRLSLCVCCSKDLFDAEEVFEVTNRAVQRLKSA